ncbi:MAG: hypothetical protein K0V04_31715 [Deltaproteobacteria bacterium]|nr:hypothetical protein [Deltaproteobacteria bacterium]
MSRRTNSSEIVRCGLLAAGLGVAAVGFGCGMEPGEAEFEPLLDEPDAAPRPQAPDTLTADPRGAARVPGFDLSIAQAGTDIALSWPSQGAGLGYDVWRSTEPYFAPGNPGATLLGNVVANNFTDVGGNDLVSYYYRLQSTGTTQPRLSTTVGKFVQPIVSTGYSLLGLPLLDTGVTDSLDLGNDIPGTIEVLRWHPYQVFYTPANPSPVWNAPAFTWSASEAVGILTDGTAGTSYTQTGVVPRAHDITRELAVGQNLATVPLSQDPIDAIGMAALEPNITQLDDWNAATQSFDNFYAPLWGTNFSIEPGRGLWIYVDPVTTWPLCANEYGWGDLLTTGPAQSQTPGNAAADTPALAMADDGSFVVAWYDDPTFEIYVQRYGPGGAPLGVATRVSTPGQFITTSPAVAMGSDGRFVVAWTPTNQNTFATYARVYDADGNPTTAAFPASPLGSHFVTGTPAVAMADTGDFVVAWTKIGISPFAVYGQRYAADGTAQGPVFPVSDELTDFVTGTASAAMDADGDFVIGWTSVGIPPFAPFVRAYDAAGNDLSGPVQASTVGSFSTDGTSIDMAANGDFVVAWRDGGVFEIQARRFGAGGTPMGAPLTVNPGTFAMQGGNFDDDAVPAQGVGCSTMARSS